jgi:metal-responsive CopG/Arc/MetJ family transcriptional regulator
MTRKVRQICISIDEQLVELIDKSRGLIPRSRYVASILQNWAQERIGKGAGGEEATPEEVASE